MTEYFRFTVELKAKVNDSPGGDEHREMSSRVQRLVNNIAADRQRLTEVYKVIFLDLLLGDYYGDILKQKLSTKTEEELILPAAKELDPQDSAFFESILSGTASDNQKAGKDNLLNMFYKQFGNPKIVDVRLELFKKEQAEAEKKS